METNQNCKSNKKFKIQFKFSSPHTFKDETPLVTFATFTNLDEAIGTALMLHAKSNTPHQFFVLDEEQVYCVLNLYPENSCQ